MDNKQRPHNKTITIYGCPELLGALDELKKQMGINLSFITIKALEKYVVDNFPQVAQNNKLIK